MTSYLLGIDLGTSACRAVIFSLEGKEISEASVKYSVYYPQPRWAEQKPIEWWNATVKTIHESIKKATIKGEEIAGLSIASQREAIVPISKEGKELYNSIIWLDNRTIPQTKKIRDIISEDKVLSITGLQLNPIYSASKILWIKENLPKVFEETACFLCAKDYIIYKLTGEFVTDYSMASRTLLFDIKRKKWSEEICRDLHIPVDKLPVTEESSKVVEVSFKASKETLPRGLPVVQWYNQKKLCQWYNGLEIHLVLKRNLKRKKQAVMHMICSSKRLRKSILVLRDSSFIHILLESFFRNLMKRLAESFLALIFHITRDILFGPCSKE